MNNGPWKQNKGRRRTRKRRRESNVWQEKTIARVPFFPNGIF